MGRGAGAWGRIRAPARSAAAGRPRGEEAGRRQAPRAGGRLGREPAPREAPASWRAKSRLCGRVAETAKFSTLFSTLAIQFTLQIGPDAFDALAELGNLKGVESFEGLADKRFAEAIEPLQHRRGRFGEKEAIRSSVVGIVATLDEAEPGELVDKARQRDRLEVELVGQFGLLDALFHLQAFEHRPLPTRHVQDSRALIGEGAEK